MRGSPATLRQRGFSLVELLIVLAIVAVLTTIALPFLLSSKISANEKAAMATLRLIGQAQVQFTTSGIADVNGNGTGEHGSVGELSGGVAVRATNGGTRVLEPTLVSPAFRAISPLGEFVKGGYYFRLYLPDAAGNGVLELPGGGAAAAVDANMAESVWCVYAWPVQGGATGRRTFFTNQSGEILFTESAAYVGAGAPIPPGAALAAGGAVNSILGTSAPGQPARDGNVWRTFGN
ncbi:MAG: type II secretion system protein [Planctomycetota bacterium]|nr:type II secretion system protein [Planctomycetota bacterium]